MKTKTLLFGRWLVFRAVIFAAFMFGSMVPLAQGADPVIDAAQKGVDFIVDDAVVFDGAHACFTCHVTAQAIRAASFADKSSALTVDIAKFNTLLSRLYTQQYDGAGSGNGAVTHVGSHTSFAGLPWTTSAWAFYGMSDIDPMTTADFDEDRFIRGAKYILTYQNANGSVPHDHFHQPVNIGDIQTTAQAIHTWRRAFDMTGDMLFSSAISEAVSFLMGASPTDAGDGRYIGDAVWIIIGLTGGGVPVDDPKVLSMVALLKGKQQGDGGWSVTATSGSMGGASDAFASGQAVCGLLAAGELNTPGFPAMQGGVNWIVANQMADGGWPGAPIGLHSRVVSSTWATICLAALAVEACNDGIDNDGDGLTDNDDPDCHVCGDGDTDPAEQCDDGNNTDGDGCSAICEVENHPPDAQCQDVTVPTDPGVCSAASASVDNGSSDPDGDAITLDQTPAGPYGLGSTGVTLKVTDVPGGLMDFCAATVTVVDEESPSITCPAPQVVECTSPSGAAASFSATSSDNCSIAATSCPASGSTFPLGTTPVTCSTTDGSGNANTCSSTVMVQDTTPPVISSVSAGPNTLWPPNHKMVSVTVGVTVTDICDPNVGPSCKIVSVTSNEPVSGPGYGNTSPDWLITGPLTVDLRAERLGKGGGRVYTVTTKCEDASGNVSAQAATTVTVPHNQ